MNRALSAHLIGTCVLGLLFAYFIAPTAQQQIENATADERDNSDASDPSVNILNNLAAASMLKNATYFQASVPMRIYECLRQFSMLRCTKLFMLQKFEEHKQLPNTGNLTNDFIQQFFDSTTDCLGSLVNEKYVKMSDKELNKRLVVKFQRFFKNRDIKLHVLPGVMLRVVPSKTNTLSFSMKKKHKQHHAYKIGRSISSLKALTGSATKSAELEENVSTSEIEPDSSYKGQGGGGIGGGLGGVKKKKNKQTSYKGAMIQMAVPILIMPAILMGSFLPFLLPALKMATFMSMILNNSAFMAALLYAARTHANAQDEQHITYGSYSHGIGPSYH